MLTAIVWLLAVAWVCAQLEWGGNPWADDPGLQRLVFLAALLWACIFATAAINR